MTLPLESAAVPYCGPPPTPLGLWSQWNFDPIVLGGLALGVALLAVRFLRMTPRARRAAGLALVSLAVAFVSPLCALSSALFAARTLHHLLLICVAAPLVAFVVAKPSRRGIGAVTAATLLQAVVLWFWHAPDLYAAALSDDVLYAVMEITLFSSALLFWTALRAASAPAAALGLVLTMVQMGLLGALIVFAGSALYAPHLATTVAWGLTPLEDQQLSGLIMWAPAAGLYLAAALVVMARWIGPDPVSAGKRSA